MRHRSRVRFAGALATTAALLVVLSGAASVSAAPAGAAQFDLFAGQTTDVGDVFVWNDATNLYVEIDLVPGWCMTESHVAVASTSAGIPQTKTGNPIPGKFAYGDTYDPCADGDVFTVPLSGFDATPVIAVHAKVWDKSQTALMNVFSNGGNTTVTASTAGGTLPRLAVDAWEAFGDPVDPTPSTWDNGVGTGTFARADWIWSEYRVNTPTVDETATFLQTFMVPGPVAPGSWMKVTTDDAYTASLNGTVVASDTWPNWPSVESASPFVPVMGPNTLGFVATNSNLSYGSGGTIDNNPGGLIYEARINYYAHSESAWAGTAIGVTQFPGANWATYFSYTLQDVLLETVTVPATAPLGATSTTVLASVDYLFKVTGTTTWLNRGGYDIVDAECVNTGGGGWQQGVAGYPNDLLDLQVDTITVDWTPVGTATNDCANNHEYTLAFTGTGATVNFRIYDGVGNVQTPGWFGDNAGSLTVEIWRTFP